MVTNDPVSAVKSGSALSTKEGSAMAENSGMATSALMVPTKS